MELNLPAMLQTAIQVENKRGMIMLTLCSLKNG